MAYTLAFYLASILKLYLAFSLASVLTFFLAFYLTCVRAQSCSTGSGAGGMEFGSRRAPQHPELSTWLGKTRLTSGGAGVGGRGRGEDEGGGEGGGETVAPLLKSRHPHHHLAGGEKCNYYNLMKIS